MKMYMQNGHKASNLCNYVGVPCDRGKLRLSSYFRVFYFRSLTPLVYSNILYLQGVFFLFSLQLCIVETVITSIVDHFPKLRTKKVFVLGGYCTVAYLLGLNCVTQVRMSSNNTEYHYMVAFDGCCQ